MSSLESAERRYRTPSSELAREVLIHGPILRSVLAQRLGLSLATLTRLDPAAFTWQVPGLREELVTALIRTLPRNLRRNFSPAPDHARAVLGRMREHTAEPLLDGLERELGDG